MSYFLANLDGIIVCCLITLPETLAVLALKLFRGRTTLGSYVSGKLYRVSKKIRGGGVVVIFDNISIVTRPVRPKAVVWYKAGMCSVAHRKISAGVRSFRCSLIASRSSLDSGNFNGTLSAGVVMIEGETVY